MTRQRIVHFCNFSACLVVKFFIGDLMFHHVHFLLSNFRTKCKVKFNISTLIFIKFIFVKSRVLNFHFFRKVFFVTFSYFPAVAPPLSTRAIKAQLSGGTIRVNLDNKTKVAEIYHCIVLENIEVFYLCVINK